MDSASRKLTSSVDLKEVGGKLVFTQKSKPTIVKDIEAERQEQVKEDSVKDDKEEPPVEHLKKPKKSPPQSKQPTPVATKESRN